MHSLSTMYFNHINYLLVIMIKYDWYFLFDRIKK